MWGFLLLPYQDKWFWDAQVLGVSAKHFYLVNYSVMPLKRGPFSSQSSQQTPHSSSVRARYEVSFVVLACIYMWFKIGKHKQVTQHHSIKSIHGCTVISQFLHHWLEHFTLCFTVLKIYTIICVWLVIKFCINRKNFDLCSAHALNETLFLRSCSF